MLLQLAPQFSVSIAVLQVAQKTLRRLTGPLTLDPTVFNHRIVEQSHDLVPFFVSISSFLKLPYIMVYKVVLRFECVNLILNCAEHLDERC